MFEQFKKYHKERPIIEVMRDSTLSQFKAYVADERETAWIAALKCVYHEFWDINTVAKRLKQELGL